MLPPSPDDKLGNAPFSDLMRVLLSQFKRLLADNDVILTADETLAVSRAVADKVPHPKLDAIQVVMKQLVLDSLLLLQDRWDFTFAHSLKTDMDSIGGWETTAEFLEIANEKSNAELRVSAGSSLLVAMGDVSYASYLLDVIQADDGVMDVDAVFAKRSLCHIADVDSMGDEWLEQLEAWLDKQSG